MGTYKGIFMTTLSAEIVADSTSPAGVRLLTLQLKYPRWLHAEVMTHRSFCRNASSSRAIPIKKMNRSIAEDPAMPLHIGRNQPGMQAFEQITDPKERQTIYSLWKTATRSAIKAAEEMMDLYGVAKQVANRLTEPHQHINVILSATDWENFFALRCHPMAEPHLQCLAWQIADLYYAGSTPTELSMGDWHLPYILPEEFEQYPVLELKKFSAARCARVSYKNHEGKKPSPEEDLKLYNRLLAGLHGDDPLEPGHLSPFEHQATPADDPAVRSGPFRGWLQHRKEFERENMAFDYQAAIDRGWRDEALAILDREFPPLV